MCVICGSHQVNKDLMLSAPGVCAGAAICDKRRDIAVAEEHFPGVDFSHIERGEDQVYEQHKVESEHAVMERGARFLQWIMARSAFAHELDCMEGKSQRASHRPRTALRRGSEGCVARYLPADQPCH